MQMLCEIRKGSDVFYCISIYFLWHKHLIYMAKTLNLYGISTFYAKKAEVFKLLGIAHEFILLAIFSSGCHISLAIWKARIKPFCSASPNQVGHKSY